MARWMRHRPEIAFAKVKEPHFFTLVDLSGLDDQALEATVREHYVGRYFAERSAATEMLGEGSISYLYAPERLLPLLRIWPDAKFVIALRDPFEMLPSVHRRLLFQGDEIETDLAMAWDMQAERARGLSIPPSCIDARQLQYLEVVRLGERVARFFEVVGRDRCHIALFDDLRDNPRQAYRELMRFVGLDDDGFDDFRPSRASRGFKYGWLQRALKRPNIITGKMLAGEKFNIRASSSATRPPSFLFRTAMKARKKMLKWNETDAPKPTLPPALQVELRRELSADVDKLASLIGRDLSHWLGRGGAAPAPSA